MNMTLLAGVSCLFIISSVVGSVESTQNSNELIESAYTHIFGVISNYSEDEYNVSFFAECTYIRFFDPWYGGYAGFAIDKEIFFNTWSYAYWKLLTKPGFKGKSLLLADYGGEVQIF